MKLLIILSILAALPLFGFSQMNTDWGVPYNEETKSIIYEEVVAVEGVAKDELYARGLNWINNYFTAGSNKISNKSNEEGVVELKDRLMFYKMEKKTKVTDVIIDYNMTILFKDGKIKYEITNFRAFQGSTSPHIEQWMEARYSDPEVAKIRFQKLNEEIEKLIDALKKDIQISLVKDKDDW